MTGLAWSLYQKIFDSLGGFGDRPSGASSGRRRRGGHRRSPSGSGEKVNKNRIDKVHIYVKKRLQMKRICDKLIPL